MSEWQAIVFDLDDTLYLERDYVYSGFAAVSAWAETRLALDRHESYRALRKLFDEGIRGDTFDRWLTSLGRHDATAISEMISVYRDHTPDIRPLPGVPELLTHLRSEVRLGLVSDGYLHVQRRKLTALNLDTAFDAVVFSDALGREAWKPSKEPFKAILQQLGADPARTVYVADNPAKDFVGPRRLGMASIRFRHPEGLHSAAEPASPADAPDIEIRVLQELEPVLASHTLTRPS